MSETKSKPADAPKSAAEQEAPKSAIAPVVAQFIAARDEFSPAFGAADRWHAAVDAAQAAGFVVANAGANGQISEAYLLNNEGKPVAETVKAKTK